MKEHHAKVRGRKINIPRPKEPRKCKHCEDTIRNDAYCEECSKYMTDQCCSCHNELAHSKIKVQNINTHGGRRYQDHSSPRVGRVIECRRRG